jgi:membrane-bound metal-dependent hydrolase YbcI (DUF457 family)
MKFDLPGEQSYSFFFIQALLILLRVPPCKLHDANIVLVISFYCFLSEYLTPWSVRLLSYNFSDFG